MIDRFVSQGKAPPNQRDSTDLNVRGADTAKMKEGANYVEVVLRTL